jgi:tRNA(adenine34) deaminase
MSNLPPNDERSPAHTDEPGSAIADDIHRSDAAARGPALESSASRAIDPRDELFMRAALAEAEIAGAAGDVPVGAVIVGPAGTIVARGRNRREQDQDPTAHAEVDALRLAARQAGAWRLEGATVYVTLEPCPMCAGALVNARVARVVYGCADPKAGAIDTLFAIGRDARLNHRFEVTSGVLATECAALLRAFFAARRGKPAAGTPNR